MKRTNSFKRSYQATFLVDNRTRRYYPPQTFWQKVIFGLIQDKHAIVAPIKQQTLTITVPATNSEAQSITETSVRIPIRRVIHTTGASVVLQSEPIR